MSWSRDSDAEGYCHRNQGGTERASHRLSFRSFPGRIACGPYAGRPGHEDDGQMRALSHIVVMKPDGLPPAGQLLHAVYTTLAE